VSPTLTPLLFVAHTLLLIKTSFRPEYLAPEIILSKGHDKAVDYWAFGVLVFELLNGQSPFYVRDSTQVEMFKRIVLLKYAIPKEFNDHASTMVQNLLVRMPSKRLGNMSQGYLDIKNHPWFEDSGIDFRSIVKMTTEPPWRPEIKDPFDASNFDDFSSVEKETDHSKRLTQEEQDIFKGF
jgi:serine/threonine protein kinase